MIVNIEETTPAAKYVNWLPFAKDTDRITVYGGDYDGDGSKDGYKTSTRLSSSSGGAVTAADMCCSGFLPCKEGDILRIKGTKPKSGTASYVMTFNSSNAKV
jgi:ribosomal protein S17